MTDDAAEHRTRDDGPGHRERDSNPERRKRDSDPERRKRDGDADHRDGGETPDRPDHLAGVEAGAGCTEIWEYLSEQRANGEE